MKLKGPWSEEEIQRFLEESRIPVRLAGNGASGFPVLASLWFVPLEGRLWCATPKSARIASILREDPRCAFEVAPESPPYRGVRGQGRATLEDARGEEILRRLVERFLGDARSEFARWLLARAASEAAIAIEPTRIMSWDFRERMAG